MANSCRQEHGDVIVFGTLRFMDGDGECGRDGFFGEYRKRIKDKVVAAFGALVVAVTGRRFFEHDAGGVPVENDDSRVAVIELEHFLVLGDDEKLSWKIAGIAPFDCFSLAFFLRFPEAFYFAANLLVDIFDATEATAFSAEDALGQ